MRISNKYTSGLCLLLIMVAGIFLGCENDDLRVYSYPPPVIDDFNPKEGRIGEEITITGSDFGDYAEAVKVFFGQDTASIQSVVDNQILALIPEGEVDGPIVVQVWTQQQQTASSFTYLPSAKVDGISPSSAEPGDEVVISGVNFGTDSSQIQVWFNAQVQAQIISVSDSEILVEVPKGGMSGALTLRVGEQTLTTSAFNYPLVGLDFDFNEDGNTQGWQAMQNADYGVSNGSLNISFNKAQFNDSKRRADLQLEGGVQVQVGAFPILAIKMDKPKSGNLILDTNFGEYKNGRNNWEGVLHGDIYYFDLRNSFGDGNILSTTEVTEFTSFQFKMADITTDEQGYSVDWIRSFESMEAFQEYAALPRGKLIYEFDHPNPTNYWVGLQNATNVIEDGRLKVSFDPFQFEGDKRRADLKYIEGGTFPSGDETGLWRYSPDYPILAFKITFTGSGAAAPETGNIKLDRFDGSANNTYLPDFVGQNVIYYDLETGFSDAQDLASFQLKIADITSSETGYELDWIRTFSSKEELSAFLEN